MVSSIAAHFQALSLLWALWWVLSWVVSLSLMCWSFRNKKESCGEANECENDDVSDFVDDDKGVSLSFIPAVPCLCVSARCPNAQTREHEPQRRTVARRGVGRWFVGSFRSTTRDSVPDNDPSHRWRAFSPFWFPFGWWECLCADSSRQPAHGRVSVHLLMACQSHKTQAGFGAMNV